MFKKIVSLMVALVMVLSLMTVGVVNVSAATIVQQGSCGDNLTYTLDSDGVLTISGSGAMTDYTFTGYAPWYTVNLDQNKVRRIVIEDGVTHIGNSAFHCRYATSVTIPDSVTSIGNEAFLGCNNLTTISIPNSVTSIGSAAFSSCYLLASITIPDGVTSIGDSMFARCKSLTSVTIPNSVTSIGYTAFKDCKSLTSITIPDGVTSVGVQAFDGCDNLTSVTIPDSVTSIGGWAFFGCKSLTSIKIPDGVTEISKAMFSDCESLTSVTIPDSVTTIGQSAFYNCSNLLSITLSDHVTTIGKDAFSVFKSENDGMTYHYTTVVTVYTYETASQVIDYCDAYEDYIEEYVFEDDPYSPTQHSYSVSKPIPYVIMRAPEPIAENEILVSGNNGKSIVTLDYNTANLKVTVPTVLPVNVDSDNNVTVADNAQVSNLSNGQVDVTGCTLSGQNEWSIVPFSTDFTKVPVNTKQYGFKLKNTVAQNNGTIALDNFDTINGDDSMALPYDANVAIQSEAIDGSDIGQIVFTVAWHK